MRVSSFLDTLPCRDLFLSVKIYVKTFPLWSAKKRPILLEITQCAEQVFKTTVGGTKRFGKTHSCILFFLTLYWKYSLVQPYFEYCSLVRGKCRHSLKAENLQKLQNRAASVITADIYDTRSRKNLSKKDYKKQQLLREIAGEIFLKKLKSRVARGMT